jgi:hypothetical protein
MGFVLLAMLPSGRSSANLAGRADRQPQSFSRAAHYRMKLEARRSPRGALEPAIAAMLILGALG